MWSDLDVDGPGLPRLEAGPSGGRTLLCHLGVFSPFSVDLTRSHLGCAIPEALTDACSV